MLPVLNHQLTVSSVVMSYLETLKQRGFVGDIETSYSSRLAAATDNSVYQLLPKAVVFPTSTQDLAMLCALANDEMFTDMCFSARGGGTGTNGQSLSSHIIVDMSRHMRNILEINIEQGWVRVQAGVVKDALNASLRRHGFFFSPELSSSNRATIGGMISTDASGQGSLRYGKTSDHVISLTCVLANGDVFDTAPLRLDKGEWVNDDATAAATSCAIKTAITTVADICQQQRAEIEKKFPPLNRFLTGYDLKNAYQPQSQSFDIARIFCGAEGTLGFISEAKLNITPIPAFRTVVNVKYDSFDSALRNAPLMLSAKALSVETVDSRVLNLARQDVIWDSVKSLLADVPGHDMQGVNMVEFAGDASQVAQPVASLCAALDRHMAKKEWGIVGYQVCDDLPSINAIYAMRKKAVGLLGATKGAAKPIAFVEDTCVPPEKLADYIAEFRALLDAHQLDYGMFGHVDCGVLHVRPALDLCSVSQERLMKSISDSVVKLLTKYGGVMWGEHGKGFRSEYVPDFFGEVLFDELRKVKTAFDPHNKMNPGKICLPFARQEHHQPAGITAMVKVTDTTRGRYDREIPVTVRDSFRHALECNGNGLCFNYDPNSPMCPSLKISYDRRHSPKGRAGIIREWLRLLAQLGVDPMALEQTLRNQPLSLRQQLQRITNSWRANHGEYDFSHEVMEVMNGCLACKACATECPINVDVPRFRARFINLYYSRYRRPVKDYVVANIETLLPWMAKMPKVVNGLIEPKWARAVTQHVIGYVDAPALSVPTLQQRLKNDAITGFDLAMLRGLTAEQRLQYVLIVQDPFTLFYEADLIVDLIRLIKKLGKTPILLPFKPNGKAQHIKGFLNQFVKTASNTAQFLNQLTDLAIPMLGLDPALVLCYRDEYNDVLGDNRGDFEVLLAHEWLLKEIENRPIAASVDPQSWYLFAHCTEKTALPNTQAQWGKIFNHFGANMEAIAVGCCGMAGTYGHESDKVEHAKEIFNLSWEEKLNALPIARCMATGYSCRSQVKRMKQQKLMHPIQALLTLW